MTVRSWLFVSTAVTAVMAGSLLSGARPATASPQEEHAVAQGCLYALSPPELVMLSGGTKAVRASLTPTKCAASAQPTDVVVCLEAANGQSECRQLPGWNYVEVIIAHAPAGGAFTSTGKGCWLEILNSFTSACRSTGPINATL